MGLICYLAMVILACGDFAAASNPVDEDNVVIPFNGRNRLNANKLFAWVCPFEEYRYKPDKCDNSATLVCFSNRNGEGCENAVKYLCMRNPCKDGEVCSNQPNATCKFDIRSSRCCHCERTLEIEDSTRESGGQVLQGNGAKPCPSNRKYYPEGMPCQKTCDNPNPQCSGKLKRGCGCSCDEFWDGIRCVSECEVCPADKQPVPCTKDPCEGGCARYPNATCTRTTCGGCRAKFYVDGKYITRRLCEERCLVTAEIMQMCYCDGSCSETNATCLYCRSGECQCDVKYEKRPLFHFEDYSFMAVNGDLCWGFYNCTITAKGKAADARLQDITEEDDDDALTFG